MLKKIFSFVLVISLLATGISFAATPGYRKSPGIGDIMGQGRKPSDPHKTFRLVRWDRNNTTHTQAKLTADSIVVWDTTSDDGVTIDFTTTTNDTAVAGIVVVDILTPEINTGGQTAINHIGKRNWGWLQTYGESQADFAADAVVTAGYAIGTSTTPGKASGYPSAGATQSGNNWGLAGFTYDTTTASATDVEVFLKCE